MNSFWSELLLFASKVAIILGVLVIFVVVGGIVIKSVVSAVSGKSRKKDDDIIFTIENYGDKLSDEKEKLEKSMLKALDDDTYEVFSKIKDKGAELKEGDEKDDNKKLVQQGFEALINFRKKEQERLEAAATAESAETLKNGKDGAKADTSVSGESADVSEGEEIEEIETVNLKEANGFTLSVSSDMTVSVTGRLMFVIDFDGSTDCNEVEYLRRAVNLLADEISEGDEVVVRLTSPGGTVNGYGLAASQLERLKRNGAKLTVAVDEVAASGGYLMACVADNLIAAPFSYIGSIGVVMELPNFHRLMKKYDVDYEQITAGEYKRTLSTFGENTEQAREKCREELRQIHGIFKSHVARFRKNVDIEKLATGEVWLASEAKELGLVDELMTSDEYIIKNMDNFAAVFNVSYTEKKKNNLVNRFLSRSAVAGVITDVIQRLGFKGYR
ncbi:protease SohB [uncultured Ruminobacter sp.]|jgi:serine protease SohB|uniref:protease SohB n=1 Tax=uncultured Ruminobacter sp. TaxID=538947 RepID=UPI0025F15E03|nr:protease SohB [uncultured Ruminobacter sp.]